MDAWARQDAKHWTCEVRHRPKMPPMHDTTGGTMDDMTARAKDALDQRLDAPAIHDGVEDHLVNPTNRRHSK